jgi:hypothetical protein
VVDPACPIPLCSYVSGPCVVGMAVRMLAEERPVAHLGGRLACFTIWLAVSRVEPCMYAAPSHWATGE